MRRPAAPPRGAPFAPASACSACGAAPRCRPAVPSLGPRVPAASAVPLPMAEATAGVSVPVPVPSGEMTPEIPGREAGRLPRFLPRAGPGRLPPGGSPRDSPRFPSRSAGAPSPTFPPECCDGPTAHGPSWRSAGCRPHPLRPSHLAAPLAHPADDFGQGTGGTHSIVGADYPRITAAPERPTEPFHRLNR